MPRALPPFTVIIPAYNEEDGIGPVIDEARAYAKNIIVVDDGGSDGTQSIARKKGVKVIVHPRNMGKVAAIKTGIAAAKTDIVVTMDADHTYPASAIPLLVGKLAAGGDLALGNRFSGGPSNIPALNRMGNLIFSFLISYASGRDIHDGQTGFRAFRKGIVRGLGIRAKGLEFETEMTIKAAMNGYEVAEVPITYRPRLGRSKLNPFADGARMLSAILGSVYSEMSFVSKGFAVPGLFLIVVSLLFGLSSLSEFLASGTLSHNYYPLICVFSALFGIQLVALAVGSDIQNKKLARLERSLAELKPRK